MVLLHYDGLKAELEGQMRKLATHLDIEVDEHRWPRLVQAARFESMRSRADTTVGAGREHWIEPAAPDDLSNGCTASRSTELARANEPSICLGESGVHGPG